MHRPSWPGAHSMLRVPGRCRPACCRGSGARNGGLARRPRPPRPARTSDWMSRISRPAPACPGASAGRARAAAPAPPAASPDDSDRRAASSIALSALSESSPAATGRWLACPRCRRGVAARPEPRHGPSAAPPLVPRAAPARPLPRPAGGAAVGARSDAPHQDAPAGTGGGSAPRSDTPCPRPATIRRLPPRPAERVAHPVEHTGGDCRGRWWGRSFGPQQPAPSPPAAVPAGPDGSSLHLSLNVGGHGGEELLRAPAAAGSRRC